MKQKDTVIIIKDVVNQAVPVKIVAITASAN